MPNRSADALRLTHHLGLPALLLASLLAFSFATACDRVEQAATDSSQHPQALVYKTPSCGCCTDWVEHLRDNGFAVKVREQSDLSDIKREYGVPYGMGSCHTAVIDGYVVEGHVPAADIQRMLRERPDAAGLAVPGMPVGSPGMELGSRRDAYTVWLLEPDEPSAYNRYPAHR